MASSSEMQFGLRAHLYSAAHGQNYFSVTSLKKTCWNVLTIVL